jgi:hypothetical protein
VTAPETESLARSDGRTITQPEPEHFPNLPMSSNQHSFLSNDAPLLRVFTIRRKESIMVDLQRSVIVDGDCWQHLRPEIRSVEVERVVLWVKTHFVEQQPRSIFRRDVLPSATHNFLDIVLAEIVNLSIVVPPDVVHPKAQQLLQFPGSHRVRLRHFIAIETSHGQARAFTIPNQMI